MSGLCVNVRQSVLQKFQYPSGPGPQDYNTAQIRPELTRPKSPQWKFATGSRDVGAVTGGGALLSPGPASHQDPFSPANNTLTGKHAENSRIHGVPVALFGTSTRSGPGLGASASGPSSGAVGPGAYDVQHSSLTQSTVIRPPAWRIGTSTRDQYSPERHNPGPGPAAYTHPDSIGLQPLSQRPSAPRARIGSAARDRAWPGSAPATGSVVGPASYDTNLIDSVSSAVLSPSKSITRPRSARTVFGTATREGASASSGAALAGTSSSSAASASAAPGPASYSPERSMSAVKRRPTSAKFGTASRDGSGGSSNSNQHYGGRQAPGPQTYDTGTAQSIGGRQFLSGRATSARAVFGTSQRGFGASSSSSSGGAYAGPGPATYAPENVTYVIKPRPTSAKFGTAARDGSGGSFNNTTNSNNVSSGSYSTGPGPAAYAVEAGISFVKPAAPRTRIGTASRDGGPGSFMPPVVSSAAAASSSSSAGNTRGGPGPQDYRPELGFDSRHVTSPRMRIGSAPRFRGDVGGSPGGHQSSSDARGGGSPTRPHSATYNSSSSSLSGGGPGPAEYDVRRSMQYTKPSPSKTVIGTASRFADGTASSSLSGSAFSKQQQHLQGLTTPGPADYQQYGGLLKISQRSPAYTMRAR